MASLTQIALSNIDSIKQSYAVNIAEPSQALKNVSQQIRDDNVIICSFERQEIGEGVSLIAVDGGNASEQLSGGDLIVAGATLGEGIHASHLYEDENEYPAELYTSILPHTSNNDKIEKTIRALLELRVLVNNEADYRIIDGAYLGNVSAVLYALLDKDPIVSNTILEYADFDADELLRKAFDLLLSPSAKIDNNIIAVPKSDSSKVYVSHVLGKYDLKKYNITDRIFANKLLLPGEFLAPRNLESNEGLITLLTNNVTRDNFGKKSSNIKHLRELVKNKLDALTRLSRGDTEEGLLWTTYFKPTAWNANSRVIKIEFLFHANDSDVSPEERARQLIQIVDQDIIEEHVQEPICQYLADLNAKNVSTSMNIIKSQMLNEIDNIDEAVGLLQKYRT